MDNSSYPYRQLVKRVNLSLCLTNYTQHHKGVWGSGCIDPYVLDLGASWRWVISFTHRSLYPQGKSPRYPLDRRLGGPQNRPARSGENSWPYRDSNSEASVVQPVSSHYTGYCIPAPINNWYNYITTSYTYSWRVAIFWSPQKVYRHFGESSRFHLQVRRIIQARNRHETVLFLSSL
jgi:hypothetical protein